MGHAMEKRLIRQQCLQRLMSLDEQERKLQESELLTQLIDHINSQSLQRVAFYFGFIPEIRTPLMIQQLLELTDSSLYLPRIEPKRRLSFRIYEPGDELEVVQGKISQPFSSKDEIAYSALDLIIVPGLAFMPSGHRVGFGGGYYDRVLAQLGPNTQTVSLILSDQLYPEGSWQPEAFDQAVGKLIQPIRSNKVNANL